MNQVVAFRLMLVSLAAIAMSFGLACAIAYRNEVLAQETMARSFDDYNRYIDACGDARSGIVWDLAERARAALDNATIRRENYAQRQGILLSAGFIALSAVVAIFYAVRWALTGRVRPLWLLQKGLTVSELLHRQSPSGVGDGRASTADKGT